ncbi:c-type cytochrome [Marinobacteraceae bacterium S3BR75-40.1]
MKKLIAGVLLVMGVAGMAYAEGGDPAAGEKNAAVCAGCHGQGGASPVQPSYPKLAGQGEKYLYKQLQDIKSGARKVVPMTGLLNNMSEQDLHDLAAYFAEKDMPIGQADPDLVKKGEALYKGGNLASNVTACAGCHSPDGSGNEPAAFPRLGGQNAEYVAAQLKAFMAGERNNDPAAMMRNVASRLTDAEIKAVASYVSGLH